MEQKPLSGCPRNSGKRRTIAQLFSRVLPKADAHQFMRGWNLIWNFIKFDSLVFKLFLPQHVYFAQANFLKCSWMTFRTSWRVRMWKYRRFKFLKNGIQEKIMYIYKEEIQNNIETTLESYAYINQTDRYFLTIVE